jgi:hypothetical protein
MADRSRSGVHRSASRDVTACIVRDDCDTARVVVFLGPTMPAPQAAASLEAEYRPPARRGDVHRALRDRFTTILLIDGEFHGCPSVWQREILDALGEGAAVHGASSMGALRAAELHGLGMVGHGRIFEWYRDGLIEADDEVALTYGPAALGYPPLCEPLVNIRATLAAAVPSTISADERDCLIAHAKGLYFPDRSFARLLDSGPASEWPTYRRDALAGFLSRSRVDQKRCDAIAALRSVAADSERCSVSATGPSLNAFWRRERLVAEGFMADIRARDPLSIARRAGIATKDLHDLRRELSELFFVAAWARANGVRATREDFALVRHRIHPAADLSPRRVALLLADWAAANAALRAFAARGGPADPRSARRAIILDWANANGIEHGGLRRDALADWIIEAGPNQFGYLWHFGVELIDALRLQARAAPLRGNGP